MRTGKLGTPEAEMAKVDRDKKKIELERVRNASQNAQQDIYAIHQPGVAREMVEQMDRSSFSAKPEDVTAISTEISESISNALAEAIKKGADKPDFSGLFDNLGKKLGKLKGTLKPEKQEAVFSFTKDMGKVNVERQKEFLGELKKLTSAMTQASNKNPAGEGK